MFITAPSSSISFGRSHCSVCHADGAGCLAAFGATSSWIKSACEVQRFSDHSGIRHENPFFGATKFYWLPVGGDISLSRVSAAADYPDFFSDSSNFIGNGGYHPLEDMRDSRTDHDSKVESLSAAEIARTTVEANSNALLIFPGMVHCEPHKQVSWAEFQYVIDEYGDVFFEIYEDNNILQDPYESNPVKALIGMDMSQYENRREESSDSDETYLFDDYFEVENSGMSANQVDWGMPDSSSRLHPVYFAKCLTKATAMEHAKMMDHPSNGISICGHLKLASIDEEDHIRRLFSIDEVSDNLDWKDEETSSFNSRNHQRCTLSTIYRMDIFKIELFSVYGAQLAVSLHDFQDAEPDILVHSSPAIVEWFEQQGLKCKFALETLCRKKGLHVELANLIGVDSLGIDVRILSGKEVQTHRLPFKVRVSSMGAAQKQIRQLLFPRSRRKKFSESHRARDLDSL